MTASLLDRVPVDRITEQARKVQFGRTLLTVITGLLFGIGWVMAKTCSVLWLGLAWSVTAVRIGWRDARGNPPTRASLKEENARLHQQIARMNNPYGGA